MSCKSHGRFSQNLITHWLNLSILIVMLLNILIVFSCAKNAQSADWRPLESKGAYYDKKSVKMRYYKNKMCCVEVWTKLPAKSNIHHIKYLLYCDKQKWQMLKGYTDKGYTYTNIDIYKTNTRSITRIMPGTNMGMLYEIVCKKRLKPLFKVKLPFLEKKQ